MIHVLFICLGNICRSPLAEAIFKHKVVRAKLEKQIGVDSAGTANYHVGQPPDDRTIAVAEKHQIPIHHYGQQFRKQHKKQFQYFIAMDSSNYKDIINCLGQKPEGLLLMRDFDDPNNKEKNVPDPYYGGVEGFEEIYQILEKCTDNFLSFLVNKYHLKSI